MILEGLGGGGEGNGGNGGGFIQRSELKAIDHTNHIETLDWIAYFKMNGERSSRSKSERNRDTNNLEGQRGRAGVMKFRGRMNYL